MTLKEVSDKYGKKESYLKDHFTQAQGAILKQYGVKIVKIGRGAKAVYEEEYESDCRALTLYDEMRESVTVGEHIFMNNCNYDFLVLLAIVITPMHVFRGTIDDFLNYIEMDRTAANRLGVQDALVYLAEEGYIKLVKDETKFTAILYERVERSMQIQVNMVKRCRNIAEAHNKRSWVPLLKTWVGLEVVSEQQPFKMKELCAVTGLSEYQVRESMKILKSDEVMRTTRAYADYETCLGQYVDLNAMAYIDHND